MSFFYDFIDKNIANFFIFFIMCLLTTFLVVFCFCPQKPAKIKKNYHYLNNIDFLKILLTYAIVLHHEYQALHWPNYAHSSVEMFFIISGFMLLYTYNSEKSVIDFIKGKIALFMPYLFLGNLLAFSLFPDADVYAFFAGIFMYSDTLLFNKFALYAPSWYIITLFWCSLFYFAMLKTYRKEVCCFVIGIIAFFAWSAMNNIVYAEAVNGYLPFLLNGQVRALSCISLGYFVALNYTPVQEAKPLLFYTILEAGLLIALIYIFFMVERELPVSLVVICFITLFYSFIYQKGYISAQLEKINWTPFSRYTLPIFMTHWVLTFIQQKGRLWAEYSSFTQIVLCLIFSTLLGIVSYHTVQSGFYFHRLRHKIFCK